MKRVNQYWFYQLATIIHPLTLAAEGASVPQLAWGYDNARDWLRVLLNNEWYTVVVSRSAVQNIIDAIDKVVPRETSEFASIPEDRKLSWIEAYRIRQAAMEFETVSSAELPTWDTYIVSKKGIYSTADLIERAEMAIDESARQALTQNVLTDFKQAGRCLAFELATAAGFHTMRAVEAVLRGYWLLVQKPTTGVKPPEMAVCINELRVAGEDPKLMDILDHIRDLHRNTIMHPEAFLTMTDALRLFDIAKSAISAMGDRITALTIAATSATPAPLAVVPIAAGAKVGAP